MRWVDVKSYVGWDRRGKRSIRLLERRTVSNDTAPPSLATALRQLRLRSLDLQDAEGVAAFRVRAGAAAQLAEGCGEVSVGKRLGRLSERLESWPHAADVAPLIEQLEGELQQIETEVESRQ
jgi:hypothetical protein